MYYFDSRNMTPSWDRPVCLPRSYDLPLSLPDASKPSPRVAESLPTLALVPTRLSNPTELTEDSAATHIQRSWRGRMARYRCHHLALEAYERMWDDKAARYFYHDIRTGRTTWEKPVVLGSLEPPVLPMAEEQSG